jgi:uncharacterized phiE125 gp8 family phage protein
MTPVLVTPPTGEIVTVAEMKVHLRIVDDTSHDAQLQAYINAAVAYLDGWRGVLGRCILAQDWSVTYDGAGTYRLPMTDIIEISAADGDENEMEITVSDGQVTIGGAGTVLMTCEMPETLLPVVVQIIKLMVEQMFDRPERPALEASKHAINMLVGAVMSARV